MGKRKFKPGDQVAIIGNRNLSNPKDKSIYHNYSLNTLCTVVRYDKSNKAGSVVLIQDKVDAKLGYGQYVNTKHIEKES